MSMTDNEKLKGFIYDRIYLDSKYNIDIEKFDIPELKELRELCQFAIVEQLLAQSEAIFAPIFPESV